MQITVFLKSAYNLHNSTFLGNENPVEYTSISECPNSAERLLKQNVSYLKETINID